MMTLGPSYNLFSILCATFEAVKEIEIFSKIHFNISNYIYYIYILGWKCVQTYK